MHKILIVDDNFENRQLITEVLRDIAECDAAANGTEAIKAYNLSLKKDPYSLILLDIEMPEVNGLEILKKIRESEEAAGIQLGDGIQIIIVTAYQKRFVEAYKYGCDDYLLKPIDVQTLMEKVQNAFKKVENK